MNLKLEKVRTKTYKERKKLNYSLFGEYIKQYKARLVFTGGFGSNTQSEITLKRDRTNIDLFHRKYQLKSIIRDYNDMRKTISSSTDVKRSNSKGNSTITRNTLFSTINNDCNSFYFNTTKKVFNVKRKLKSDVHNKSALDKTSSSFYNKAFTDKTNRSSIKRQVNQFRTSRVNQFDLNNNTNNNNNSILTKYNKTIFTKNKKGFDDNDPNCIFEKLKRKYNFYQEAKESKYEENKWKMFKKKELSQRLVPKNSIHWIKLMKRKENSHQSK